MPLRCGVGMGVKILNVYDNKALPMKDLKGGHGESFHITVGDQQVLFDAGWKGSKLLHNLRTLGIDPDEIDKLVFSHGHGDHAGGVSSFLRERTSSTPLPVIAHPDVLEPKSLRLALLRVPMGFPKLDSALMEKVVFELARTQTVVFPNLFTTGEIALAERSEKPGIERRVYHKVAGKWMWDPVVDDLSLILRVREGMVIVTGCCHAGLLNTCAKARTMFKDPIRAIVGGTHMLNYSREDVEHVGDVLEGLYETPMLYLNHCTGRRAIEQLRDRFGSEIVHNCNVGTELTYQS